MVPQNPTAFKGTLVLAGCRKTHKPQCTVLYTIGSLGDTPFPKKLGLGRAYFGFQGSLGSLSLRGLS